MTRLTGTLPYQVPTNSDLGTAAYLDANAVQTPQVKMEATIPLNGLTYYTDFEPNTSVSGNTVNASIGSGAITMVYGSLMTNEPRKYWRFGQGTTSAGAGSGYASSNIASRTNLQSFAFWIRTGRSPNQTDDFGIGFYGNGTTGAGFCLQYGVNAAYDLGFWGYGADYYPYNNSSYMTQNGEWHHIAIVKNDTNSVWMYHNGELMPYWGGGASGTFVTGLSNTATINFGMWCGITAPSYYDVRGIAVYARTLTQTEARQLYFNT